MNPDDIKTILVCKYAVTEKHKQALEDWEYDF